MFENNKEEFLSKVTREVALSLDRMYASPEDEHCPIRFSPHIPAHDLVKDALFSVSEAVGDDSAEDLVDSQQMRGTEGTVMSRGEVNSQQSPEIVRGVDTPTKKLFT